MSLFRRDDAPQPTHTSSAPEPMKPNPSPPRPNAGPTRTTVAAATRIEGRISGTCQLVIQGEVEGSIELESEVVVEPGGTVRGDVIGKTVHIAGKVIGNVEGLERVEVGASGSLEGDVAAPRVAIAEGAFFRGKVDMSGRSSKRKAEPVVGPANRSGTVAGKPKGGSETGGAGKGAS